MTTRTITAMFSSRNEAEQAVAAIHANAALATTDVKVLPEPGSTTGAVVEPERHDEGGFMATLRHFFMPEEDRYGYAEGMRRGSVMVVVETDDPHSHAVMDVLENAGAVDLDTEETKWRNDGWHGYEPSSSATTSAAMIDTAGETTIPPTLGTTASMTAGATPTSTATYATGTSGRGTLTGKETEERIPLVEENLRVGKRQVIEGRVRIRSYVVETPVSETVHLRDEHVEVERRPVDRPLTGAEADPFRERELEATETREEPVVSKEARVREELVMHKSIQDRDEELHDTLRRTEVKQDEGDVAISDNNAAVRNPGA
jgi:uncharacterized protein (TIGR02271 family)